MEKNKLEYIKIKTSIHPNTPLSKISINHGVEIFLQQKSNKGIVGKMCKTSTTNQIFNGQEVLIGNSHNKGNLSG